MTNTKPDTDTTPVVDVEKLVQEYEEWDCGKGTQIEFCPPGFVGRLFAGLRQQQEEIFERTRERDAEANGVTRLSEENARLRGVIARAPCANYEGKGNGLCSDCECWKQKALSPDKELT